MKLISELNVGGMLRAGCTCSEGRTKTRGLWDPFWNRKDSMIFNHIRI